MTTARDGEVRRAHWQDWELPLSLFAAEWERLPTRSKVAALTFDAGWGAEATEAILSTLAAADVPATFFLTGVFAELYPDATREIARAHVVGNHTYSHPYLTRCSATTLREELHRAEVVIQETTGRSCRPLFRFPYGDADRRTVLLVNGLGYAAIRWSVDTLGWLGSAAAGPASSVAERVRTGLDPGGIVLMHVGATPDGATLDADALPRVLDEAAAQGYRWVRLEQFLSDDPPS